MKLLQKTIRRYLVFSVFILLVAIPVFYFVIKRIVKEDTDEHLQATKVVMRSRITRAIRDHSLPGLNFADPDIVLSESREPGDFESLMNRDVYDSTSGETVPYRILLANFTIDGRSYLLQVRNSMVDGEDLIESIVKVQVVLLLVLLSGLLLINRSLSKRIWRPFYMTLEKLRNYKVEQQQPLALVKSSVNEFDDLNRSLEELTERIRQSYLTQKEFTENASHEIQTPLAVFQSKLELLMQTSPVNNEQAELIGDLANASQRMARLNKSLILLTRIENLQFAATESISLAVVVEKNLIQIQHQLEGKAISVQCEFQEAPVLEANHSLVEVLVSNLFSNAMRYNIPGGSIGVTLKKNQLVFENTGTAAALDRQQIFRRFYKENTDANSIGLGLQIVKQISNLYGWMIDYEYRDGWHRFILSF